jgi:hypothetical protein
MQGYYVPVTDFCNHCYYQVFCSSFEVVPLIKQEVTNNMKADNNITLVVESCYYKFEVKRNKPNEFLMLGNESHNKAKENFNR